MLCVRRQLDHPHKIEIKVSIAIRNPHFPEPERDFHKFFYL